MREKAGPSQGVVFSCSGVIVRGSFALDLLENKQDSVAAAANWLISALRSSTAWMICAPDQQSVFVMKTSRLRARAKCSASTDIGVLMGSGGTSSERRTARLVRLRSRCLWCLSPFRPLLTAP